jgi:hypothetical protein
VKFLTLILVYLICLQSVAQADSTYFMRVHFLYGSRPKFKYRETEKRVFGGLHGGHVSIQVDGMDYGFERSGGFHIFPRRKKYRARFTGQSSDSILNANRNSKTATFIVPLNDTQFKTLNRIHSNYCEQVPYDYAFFGMRCAASVREILGQLNIIERRSRMKYITGFFYPKRLRKKMFRLARKKNYQIITTPGRATRRWEKD